jgi:hypothetical protein
MLVDGCMCVNRLDSTLSSYDPQLDCPAYLSRRKGARLRENLQPRNFGGNPECVDRTAGSSSDISGQTIAFPNLKFLLIQSALRYHSVLPCPVSIAQRIRSCWDRSSFV